MMAEREEIRRSGNGDGKTTSGFTTRVREFFVELGQYPKRFRQFVHETRVELKHVSWPTRDDVKSTTIVVVITIFVFGTFLFGVDSAISNLVRWVLGAFK